LNLKANGYNDPCNIIKLLSIRDHPEESHIPIREEHQYLINTSEGTLINESDVKKVGTISVRKLHKQQHQAQLQNLSIIDLDIVRELVKMLAPERAEDYATWIEVGLCLHNISSGLLPEWIEFSQKSSKADTCTIFEDKWSGMKMVTEGGMGMGSLHLWAKLDNPDEYGKFRQHSISSDIMKSVSLQTYDVAMVVYKLYQHQFICSSIKSNSWYEFKNHRWHKIDGGYSLQIKLSKDVVDEYLKLIRYYSENAQNLDGEARDSSLEKIKDLAEVTYKLRDITFKEKIMKECKLMFYDSTFETRLDSNPDLVCFDNGVYDLVYHKFRDGCPEDCLSMSTMIDYETCYLEDEIVQEIFEFLKQVFPDQSVREFVLTILGSIMEGRNPHEKFFIWTGVGGNGKSKLLELFELSAGKYAAKVPVTVFTQKRAASNAATPEIARLRGVRLTSSQETEESEKFNISVVKDWSGNDTQLARPLFGDPFEFKPQFKQIFCCNDKPLLPPDDGGIWRRIVVIDFPSRFVENPDPSNPFEFKRDYRLAEKFQQWKGPFMWIILQYYKNVYKKFGLKEPKAVIDSIQEYRESNDDMAEFKNERIVKDIESNIKLDNCYKEYIEWWKEASGGVSRKQITRSQFKTVLERKLGKYNNTHGWRGWRMIDKITETSEITVSNTCLLP
jgi:P4 family phage/plasmid primase-like protien